MSLFTDGIATLSVGETLIGTDNGNLVNTRMEGREAWISHEDILNYTGTKIVDGSLGLRSRVRVMRNTSGAALLPGELAVFAATSAANLGKASAKADADGKFWVVVDPLLPAAGVADDDLFIAFIGGPTKVKAPAAGLTLAAAGLPLVAAASGRATFGATDGSESEIIGGFFLGSGSIAANALVDAVLSPPWV